MRSILVSAAIAGLAFLQPGAAESHVTERDSTCALQPPGSGHVPQPDTPEEFLAYSGLWNMALTAPTPDGYMLAFKNLTASLSADKYMGLYTITSYSTEECASLCTNTIGCKAFNMYAERDPSEDPNAERCKDPPSVTNYKCTLWGTHVSSEDATNYGQWRNLFRVVISASNAYNKIPACKGGSCYNFSRCGSKPNCFCFKTIEGGSVCAPRRPCRFAKSCASSEDCPSDSRCVVQTCCGTRAVCSSPASQCLASTGIEESLAVASDPYEPTTADDRTG